MVLVMIIDYKTAQNRISAVNKEQHYEKFFE